MNVLDARKRFGRLGEQHASKLITAKGFRVICSNWYDREGEIDLIALDAAGALHMIEVRSRVIPLPMGQMLTEFQKEEGLGCAFESVNRRKQQKLRAAAKRFLNVHPEFVGRAICFDVIAILISRMDDQILASQLLETAF